MIRNLTRRISIINVYRDYITMIRYESYFHKHGSKGEDN